jgi:CRP-like cAMP-binding protein
MDEMLINLEQRIVLLKRIAVFNSLSNEALEKLSLLLQERKTRAQESLFRKGEQGENMYILAEGEVRVHDGNHVIARLGAGEVFGEYALFDTENRSASVTTEKQCVILVLDRISLMDFLKKYPELLMGMLQLQIKRMREMNELEEKLSKSYLKISKQKQEIEAQHEAIKDQKKQLEAQNKSLEELNNQKKQLLSVIIHGLKNPMTSVSVMAEMIRSSDQLAPELEEYASILLHSVNRMDKVINDMIRTNQAEELFEDKPQQRINCLEILQELLDENAPTIEKKRIKFSVPKSDHFLNHNLTSVQLMMEQFLNWIFSFADEDQLVEFKLGNSGESFVLQTDFKPIEQLHACLEMDSLSWWQLALIAEEDENFDRFSYLKLLFRQAGASVNWSFKSKRLSLSFLLN